MSTTITPLTVTALKPAKGTNRQARARVQAALRLAEMNRQRAAAKLADKQRRATEMISLIERNRADHATYYRNLDLGRIL